MGTRYLFINSVLCLFQWEHFVIGEASRNSDVSQCYGGEMSDG